MKKAVALLVAVCMLVAVLAGCGAENSTAGNDVSSQTNKAPSEKETGAMTEPADNGVPAGTILYAPEAKFDANAEELYIHYTRSEQTRLSGPQTWTEAIAIDRVDADTYLIYVPANPNSNLGDIYEVTDEGVTKYVRDEYMDAYEMSFELSALSEMKKDELLSMLDFFMVKGSAFAGLRYRKSDDKIEVPTGEVYVYDLMEYSDCVGQIGIDKATGLLVYYKYLSTEYIVQEFKTADVEIPAYK